MVDITHGGVRTLQSLLSGQKNYAIFTPFPGLIVKGEKMRSTFSAILGVPLIVGGEQSREGNKTYRFFLEKSIPIVRQETT